MLARDLHADTLIIATDVDGVYLDWGRRRAVGSATPTPTHSNLATSLRVPWGPKVAAAVQFAQETGGRAVIGSLDDLDGLVVRPYVFRARPQGGRCNCADH